MISVTKPYLPSRKKLESYIDKIYERNWLTNNGPLVQELTDRLEDYLSVKNLLLVNNGTSALNIAYAALGCIEDLENKYQALTTPFTFVATSSSLRWDGLSPVYCDINENDWCVESKQVEESITPNTAVIVPVHVFGNSCDCVKLDEIAKKNDVPIIYDAAHAFGVNHKGKNILSYGDASTLSFHATKLFHSIEGGAVVFKSKESHEIANSLINFGFDIGGEIARVGTNAKMNEFQAAMALCNLDEIDLITESREEAWNYYYESLSLYYQVQQKDTDNNYSYFPVLLNSEEELIVIINELKNRNIVARRYFSPSLNTTNVYGNDFISCPISEKISKRIICLPLFVGITKEIQSIVVNVLKGIN